MPHQDSRKLLIIRAISKDTIIYPGAHPTQQETLRCRTSGLTTKISDRARIIMARTTKTTQLRRTEPRQHPRQQPQHQGGSNHNKQGMTDPPFGSPPRNHKTFPYPQSKSVSQPSSTSAQATQDETPSKHMLTTHETQKSGDEACNQNP